MYTMIGRTTHLLQFSPHFARGWFTDFTNAHWFVVLHKGLFTLAVGPWGCTNFSSRMAIFFIHPHWMTDNSGWCMAWCFWILLQRFTSMKHMKYGGQMTTQIINTKSTLQINTILKTGKNKGMRRVEGSWCSPHGWHTCRTCRISV